MEITLEDAEEKVATAYNSLKLDEFRNSQKPKSADVKDLAPKPPADLPSELDHIKAKMGQIEALFKDLQFDTINKQNLVNFNLGSISQKTQ